MKLEKIVRIILCLAFIWLSACQQQTINTNEPPMSFGNNPSGPVRSTDFQGFAEGQKIIYEVHYPAYNLISVATLDFMSKAMLEEVFSGKWIIVYEYKEAFMKYSHLPSSFTVYENNGGITGNIINQYSFIEATSEGFLVYQDSGGRKKEIDSGYFDIIPVSTGFF